MYGFTEIGIYEYVDVMIYRLVIRLIINKTRRKAVSQDNSKDPKAVEQAKNKQCTESLVIKAIIFCLAFTYCAFIVSHFFNINVIHKFEKGGMYFKIEHSGRMSQ